jgi:hypothetical protein
LQPHLLHRTPHGGRDGCFQDVHAEIEVEVRFSSQCRKHGTALQVAFIHCLHNTIAEVAGVADVGCFVHNRKPSSKGAMRFLLFPYSILHNVSWSDTDVTGWRVCLPVSSSVRYSLCSCEHNALRCQSTNVTARQLQLTYLWLHLGSQTSRAYHPRGRSHARSCDRA